VPDSKIMPGPQQGQEDRKKWDGLADGLVNQLNPLAISDWDQRVKLNPHSTFFHGAAWARVLVETYGYQPLYLTTVRNGTGSGLLPLMEVNSWLTGKRGVGLPFTDECEPLAADQAGFQKLHQSALELARSRQWKSVEYRGGQAFFAGTPPSLCHYTHRVKLSRDAQALFAGLEGGVRRAIRKAEKETVQIEVSRDLAAVKVFYQLLVKTRRRHGLPPQPFRLFHNIYRHILSQNMGVVVVARKGHTPIGAAVFFQWADEVIYKYGASDERFQHLRPNNLVMWEAIKWHGGHGLQTLNLGRTSLANSGLRRFKLGWGAAEEKIAYYKFDLQHERFVVEQDETAGWYNQFFRSAPGFVSRLAGQVLYRHWA
jgi:hypothetical protein